MKNKVLVKLYVPELDSCYDLFIPINEIIWKIKKLIAKSIYDLSNGVLDYRLNFALINKLTSQIYDNNEILANTDIKNATELIFISTKDSGEFL